MRNHLPLLAQNQWVKTVKATGNTGMEVAELEERIKGTGMEKGEMKWQKKREGRGRGT